MLPTILLEVVLVKVVRDYKEFLKLVEPLCFNDFESLNIEPTMPSGVFGYDRHYELVEFCRKNPEYHVISHLGSGVIVNKPLEKVTSYELGRGENNPDLVYIESASWEYYVCLKTIKFNIDKL